MKDHDFLLKDLIDARGTKAPGKSQEFFKSGRIWYVWIRHCETNRMTPCGDIYEQF